MINDVNGLPIWVANLDIDTSKILLLAKDLFEKNALPHQLEFGDAQSTYQFNNNILEMPEFDEIRAQVLAHGKQYWDAYGLDPSMDPEVNTSWMNRHGHLGITLPHLHSGAPIVGVFYLQFEQGNGNLFLEDPLEYHKCHEPRAGWESETELMIQQNDLILFPGYVKHRTGPNYLKKDRYIISFNFGM